ncbi:Origin recognition complex, subunit 1 [Batrachochytrium dendrobatidis]|nr:Origin recognition complex, subunit 1 [Batrachochytrium dendrobatidis]
MLTTIDPTSPFVSHENSSSRNPECSDGLVMFSKHSRKKSHVDLQQSHIPLQLDLIDDLLQNQETGISSIKCPSTQTFSKVLNKKSKPRLKRTAACQLADDVIISLEFLDPIQLLSTPNQSSSSSRPSTRLSAKNSICYRSFKVNGMVFNLGDTVVMRTEVDLVDPILKLTRIEKKPGDEICIGGHALQRSSASYKIRGHWKSLEEHLNLHKNEALYSTTFSQVDPMLLIGKCMVMSEQTFFETYPNGLDQKDEHDPVMFCSKLWDSNTLKILNGFDWNNFVNAHDPDAQVSVRKKRHAGSDVTVKISTKKRQKTTDSKPAFHADATSTTGRSLNLCTLPKTPSKIGHGMVEMGSIKPQSYKKSNSLTRKPSNDSKDDTFTDTECFEVEESSDDSEKDDISESDTIDDQYDVSADENSTPLKAKSIVKLKRKSPLQSKHRKRVSTRTKAIEKRLKQLPKKLPDRIIGKRGAETDTARAIELLHVGAVPDTLPGREIEFAEIYSHIEDAIIEGNGACIYVSGVPGTGKTVTFNAVMRLLQEQADDESVLPFDFVEINGMKLTEPTQAYVSLWQGLTNEKVTPKHAQSLLQTRFTTASPNRRSCVVLMDELDMLVNKSQSVVYNFFEWPNLPYSKLVVVAIANTMDLPERMLSNKISSRLGLTRITFQPYTHTQLFSIVEARLRGIQSFDRKAIEFCARKVGGVSGDARRALDICKRAVEIFEATSKGTTGETITVRHIDKVVDEMFSTPIIKTIRSISVQQRLFIAAILRQVRFSGTSQVTFGQVAETHLDLCCRLGMKEPTMSALVSICAFLGNYRLIHAERIMISDPEQKLQLSVSREDVIAAVELEKETSLKKILEGV